MITLLAKYLIREGLNEQEERRAYGMLCGAVGIGWNVLLFIGKILAGMISGSIAVTADAFNNLSDAGSSLVTLLGFRLAGQKPDAHHPFGHGRIEYLSGLVVSMMILMMGFELAKTSVGKILHPEAVTFSPEVAAILGLSIAVKLYMFFYNRDIGRHLNSKAMEATAADCVSDAVATAAVLLATLVGALTGWKIDGWCGLAVSVFIFRAGIKAAGETLDPLLGTPPTEEFVRHIERLVMAHEEVRGIHDLIVHDYGPGRVMISLHAEVSADQDMLQIHDTIDNIERELQEKLGCQTVIHMDPVVADARTKELRGKVEALVREIDSSVSIHDFRMVVGHTHTNVIFDAVVPAGFRLSNDEVRDAISAAVRNMEGNYFAVVNVEQPYT